MPRFNSLVLTLALLSGSANALYDPKPDESLYAAQGEWRGSLTYKDYSQPDRLVTLPTTLFIALAGPNDLVLHYTFADGPGKTVYSYEQMKFDFAAKRVTWVSGLSERSETAARITSDTQDSAVRRVVFESDAKDEKQRFTLELSAAALSLQKEELPTTGAPFVRNRFAFKRTR